MRSRYGYALGALSLAVAVVVGVLGFGHLGKVVDSMQRLPMPGAGVFHAPAGDVTLFIEDSGAGFLPKRETVRCSLGAGAAEVPLVRHSARTRYGHMVSVFTATIPEAGDLPIRCESDSNRPFRIVLGEGVGSLMALTIVGMLAPAFAGLALSIVTALRRRRAAARG